ncbi:MAG TPA: EAL domain-containing protein, partial [Steroidobacteraceae bacterium]|nr:EAL domain-containing protein [Steroidobacteraceae bacterium]
SESFAFEYACHNGAEKRWLRMMATPVARNGNGGAVVMLFNVTDRKLAEEQLKINASALRNLSEGVIITDHDLQIVAVNKAFVTLTGHTADSAVGMSLPAVIVHEYPESLIAAIRAAVAQNGSWKGELRSRRANGEVFPAFFSFSAVRDHAGAIESYTAVFADLSTFREFERRIEYLSHNDTLTGLPNRAALRQQVQGMVDGSNSSIHGLDARPVSQFALLVTELDSFKTVNDTAGFAAGDLLLKSVAERLRRVVRPGDVLTHLGGDEFGILALDISDDRQADRLAERVRLAIERPFNIAGQDVFITTSVGVSAYPRDGKDFDELLRAAAAAVYRAKQLGRNTVTWYSPETNNSAADRFTLRNSLPQALARQEFILEYQPTVDLFTGRLTGAEALLRWRHPQLGLMPPSRFIGLAEDTGLIVQIGHWVLMSACQQVSQWIDDGWEDATVAVNLSARQFNQPDLHSHIAEALSAANIEPWRLRLEVTESMVMTDPDAAAATLQRWSRMGIQLALDDFGTGYSSLNYLKRFRLGCIKVDRSFVENVVSDTEDASIVRAIVALGKALGMKIIAEGIETAAQADFLRDVGCDDGQGFYYSPATSGADIRSMAMSHFPLAAGSLQSQLDLVIKSSN